jgi:Phage portal protein
MFALDMLTAAAPPKPTERGSGMLSIPTGIASLKPPAVGQLGPFIVPPMPEGWLTRATAWRVPAAAQALQIIAGTLSTLPLARWRGPMLTGDDSLIAQPDPATTRSATIMATVEDLVLYPYAYWIVLARDGRNFPIAARHVPADRVDDRLTEEGIIRYEKEEYEAKAVLRFASPTPGLTLTGADALWTAYLLSRAAQRYANEPVPSGYLQNTGAVDLEEDEIDNLLDTWAAARQARATAYVGPNVNYQTTSFNAEQLQLTAGRELASAEIARLCNLPPHYVNAPQAGGSSMTYTTLETARRDLVDLCLGQYMAAVCDRLSLDDVTPHGQEVRFSLAAFYRSDFAGLVTSGVAAVAAGLVSVTEWRRLAGLPDQLDNGEGA